MRDDIISTRLTVDARPFEQAMQEYARFDKRTLPEILTAKLGDWAWEAAKRSPFALAAHIRMLKDNIRGGKLVWWRFVQSVINNGFVIHGRRKATIAEESKGYIDAATGKWIMRRRTVGTYKTTTYKDAFKIGMLEKVGNQIVRRRAARAKAIGAQFLFVAFKLGKSVGQMESKGRSYSKYAGIMVNEARIHGMKAAAAFSIPFRAMTLENKEHEGDRPRRSQQKADIAMRPVIAARNAVVLDMQRKTAERYAREARRVSGVGRAA